ncbi:MAG: hypothetical protein M1832_002183 [Thelocarpon impressellum]|nr:MAG: hypothetical protein M1832_002183 [Thelocarpon impressellum]
MAPDAVDRPRVYLDINIGNDPAGRLVIELFVDKAPRACENFRVLCAASKAPSPSYKLSTFHRLIDEFIIQGGDISAGNGTGGTSIYGGEFEDEADAWSECDREGLVCLANRGKGTNTNSSQFFITLAPSEQTNAVFGHVVSGEHVLSELAKVKVDKNDRPLTDITIANCGELQRRKKIVDGREEARIEARGRKRRRASAEPSPKPSRTPSPHQEQKHRRRDSSLDPNLRGRPRRRSASRYTPPQDDGGPHRRPKARRRSQSPSRSRTPSVASPRRRRYRSRSHPRPHGNVRVPANHAYRPSEFEDEERFLRAQELERDGDEGRFEGVIGEDDDDHSRPGERRQQQQQQWGRPDRRLGGGGRQGNSGGGSDGGGEVKFKGRGRMNYREKTTGRLHQR